MADSDDDIDDEVVRVQVKQPDGPLDCRYYENQFPAVEEVVMVKVKAIQDMGAYVSLLEYNHIEGMILLSELSRRRIRSINKLIRIGKDEIVMVLRVDKEKGYIDLSKRRVSPEDIAKCDERYNKAKAVHSVLRQVAENHKMRLEDLYIKLGWPLYNKYGHAYEAFRKGITEPEEVFGEFELGEDIMKTLMNQMRKRLTPQPIKIRADIEVTCFDYEGIDAIKRALLAGQSVSTKDSPVKIKLIAPPLYVMTTSTLDKAGGLKALDEAIKEIKTSIENDGGQMNVQHAPKVITRDDETELQKELLRLEQEQNEVDGDDDDEDDE